MPSLRLAKMHLTRTFPLSAVLVSLVFALPLLILWKMAEPIYPFIEDDALISLRYARRLLDGQGLTWTAGTPVEGYSNLLWVLLSALGGALSLDLILVVRILGIASIVGCLGALINTALQTRRIKGSRSNLSLTLTLWCAGAAGVYLCASGSTALWSIAGLEQPLVAFLLLWALSCAPTLLTSNQNSSKSRKAELQVAIPLAGLVLTRPDSPLFVVLFAVYITLYNRSPIRVRLLVALRVISLPLLAWLGQLGFRLAYYNDVVPNTAYLKASFQWERVAGGWDYLKKGYEFLWPMAWGAALSAAYGLYHPRLRGWIFLHLSCIGFWLAYVVAIGGDHFPGHRHILLVVAICSNLITIALVRAWSAAQGLTRIYRLPLGAASCALLLGVPSFMELQERDPDYQMGTLARWQWDAEPLGKLFARGFSKEQPLWAVTAAGCMPYFSNLPSLDMLGLNDRHIARQPADLSQPLAHDHGDGIYVLDRKPDLITFGLPTGGPPHFLSGKQMKTDPRFRQDYQRVTFHAFAPHFVENKSYVRVYGKIGIQQSDEKITVPAYLLSGVIGQSVASSRVGALLKRRVFSITPPLTLPPGRYQIALTPPNPLLEIQLMTLDGDVQVHSGDSPQLSVVNGKAKVRLRLRSQQFDTTLFALELTRLDAKQAVKPFTVSSKRVELLRRAKKMSLDGKVLLSQNFETSLQGWLLKGDAMSVVKQSPPTQGTVQGTKGKFLNSFHATELDGATGTAQSPSFVPTEFSFLRLRLGGGRAHEYPSQVGVALHNQQGVLQVLTGESKPRLIEHWLDLSPYAGQSLFLEVFDRGQLSWGHIMIDELEVRASEPLN